MSALSWSRFVPLCFAVAVHAQERRRLDVPEGSDFGRSFSVAEPEQVGLDSARLVGLAEWIRDTPVPIFSLLVSRDGRLVFEAYTSDLDREQAHYLMSVTKTVTGGLVGVAIDRGLLPGPHTAVTKALPHGLFASDADIERFRRLTIAQVLDMTALDALVPPHDDSAAARQRQEAFWSAENRVAFALTQPLLSGAGTFQYNDVTPMLATGLVQYAAGTTAFEFAQEHLFGPMGFRNAEWMHQDRSGVDLGGYGLRLRPIDMQKLGVLYLRRGVWEGRRLLSKSWVERSFTPSVRTSSEVTEPNYGTYWWTRRDGTRWTRHEADGWKGQRIAVIPGAELVVTMTACIEDGSEAEVFTRILRDHIEPAVENRRGAAVRPSPKAHARLLEVLEELRGCQRIDPSIEERMVPSARSKEQRRPFTEAR